MHFLHFESLNHFLLLFYYYLYLYLYLLLLPITIISIFSLIN